MSWKRSGNLVSGPPTSSNSSKLDPRFRPNLGGLSAFQREQQLARRYGSDVGSVKEGRTEWDVLKENHRFIRDDEGPSDVTWEERLARAYESKLFKEFALIDLKHYKSKRLALRWRTAPEVVEGIGEDTCASLRCKYHRSEPLSPPIPERVLFDDTPGPSVSERGSSKKRRTMPPLRAFELPFVYEEAGERKEALVKVKLCPQCQSKLVWKPGKEEPTSDEGDEEQLVDKVPARENKRSERQDEEEKRRQRRNADDADDADNSDDERQHRKHVSHERRHRVRSRSQSPHRPRREKDRRDRRRH